MFAGPLHALFDRMDRPLASGMTRCDILTDAGNDSGNDANDARNDTRSDGGAEVRYETTDSVRAPRGIPDMSVSAMKIWTSRERRYTILNGGDLGT
jgi:hypothetical protein